MNLINDQYTPDCGKEWLAELIAKYHHPNRFVVVSDDTSAESTPKTLVEYYDYFMEKHEISEVRKKNFRVIGRVIRRYELFTRIKKRNKDFTLYLDEVTADTLDDMWNFFRDEHVLYEKYPKIYEAIPETRAPKARGRNALIDYFNRFRAFFLWCYEKKITKNRPFDDFKIGDCTYGTPILISKEERNQLYEADLSAFPEVAVQRDIFVFQSLVGCRPAA